MKRKFAYYPLNNSSFLLILTLAGSASMPFETAQALDWYDGRVQLHGFFTQGVVYTTHNNFYGNTQDRIGLDFREIGLNVSLQPFSRLRLSAQGTSRWAGKMDQGEPWLDYALADFTLFNDEERRIGIRLGRIKNIFGLYTETRDVASTRPGVILPQPIYFDRSRKFALSGDGVHLYGEFEVPGGNLDVRLMAADLPLNDQSSKTTLTGSLNTPGHLDQDRMTPGVRIIYETDNKRWRGGFTYLSLSQRYRPAQYDAMAGRQVLIEPWIISLQYSGEQLTLTSEFSQRYSEFIYREAIPKQKITSQNWYVQAQYRFLPSWELLLRYDDSIDNIDDPDGKDYAATHPSAFAHNRFSRDWVTGLRYDVTSSFMLRAEFHHVDGTNWLSRLDNPDPSKLERRWDMLMFLASFWF
ncbi:MAG: hypothetical protein PHE55_16735 [Methylococcaceae bacterium]|nr:hypothetical protein [Methylococcaceae bacterium]